jgi:uncharacterized protein YneF (UPF0154 family)
MSEQNEPEEKFKTLINLGVGFSILLIIGIFVTIGVTATRIAENPRMNEDRYQYLVDSMMSVTVTDDYDYYDDPGTYYDATSWDLETENDSLREVIRNSYTSSYKEKLLDHLETETDHCTKLIRDILEDLGDTMLQPGVSGPAVSVDFFQRTQRDEELFSAMFSFRETCEDLAPDAGVYDAIVYRDYLPLREASAYGYIKSWDEAFLEQDPVDVVNYLKDLELDLRYYENQLLWDMM